MITLRTKVISHCLKVWKHLSSRLLLFSCHPFLRRMISLLKIRVDILTCNKTFNHLINYLHMNESRRELSQELNQTSLGILYSKIGHLSRDQQVLQASMFLKVVILFRDKVLQEDKAITRENPKDMDTLPSRKLLSTLKTRK